MNYQFTLFRTIFGAYLSYHFYEILPYAEELFTSHGMISHPEYLPAYNLVKYFTLIDNNIQIFILTLIALSVMLSLGYLHKAGIIILWLGWVYLFNKNVFIANPGIPYVGILLLVCAMPNHRHMKWVVWFLMMMGYTVSGIHKLQCQSWLDGTVLLHIVASPIARNNIFTHCFFMLPLGIIKIFTWGSLLLESTSLIFGIFYHTRKWYWLALVSMHCTVLLLINFTDLTLGVLMMHVYTFDPNWFKDFWSKVFELLSIICVSHLYIMIYVFHKYGDVFPKITELLLTIYLKCLMIAIYIYDRFALVWKKKMIN